MPKPKGRNAPARASSPLEQGHLKQGRPKQKPARPAPSAIVRTHWRTHFLQELAVTSNVSASAALAGVSASRAYKARRENPEFAARWRAALHEGYEHLEMEVLAYLRGTQPERKIDVANAIRLLAAHRETVARQRALEEDGDEQAVLDSIDAMIDQMRQRKLAASAGHPDIIHGQ